MDLCEANWFDAITAEPPATRKQCALLDKMRVEFPSIPEPHDKADASALIAIWLPEYLPRRHYELADAACDAMMDCWGDIC